jgi:Pro-kumamolisin, activation domain/Bacterial Ig-like domain (group 3)
MKKTSTLILRNSLLLLATLFAFSSIRATAQTSAQTTLAAPRITQAIDETKLVSMGTKVYSLARAEFDRGVVADSQPVNRMLLQLQRSPQQETALRELLDEQQTRNSPNFHAWLTPTQFGQQFGVADEDIQTVTTWLAQQGFSGIKVSPGRMLIEFSGNAGLVRRAFHTEIHQFMVSGEMHMANVSVPQMPAALAPVVTGIVSLHNFRKKSFLRNSPAAARLKAEGKLKPGFTAAPCASLGPGPCYAMGPADFKTIYNVPSALDGTNQTIALVERSNIAVSDVNQYGQGFGISNLTSFSSANVVLESSDPGIIEGDDQEATLDVEVAGGIAPKANILMVVADGSATTSFSDGVDLAAIAIVQFNLAGQMSESFGSAEEDTDTTFYQDLWEQAAAQGITVMLSTGDSGSASADGDAGNIEAVNGLAVSGLATTQFNVAVGGTDFDDATNPTTYWNSTNGTGLVSAKHYIPETAWNDSCAATATTGSLGTCASVTPDPGGLDLAGGGGGQSGICGLQDQNGNCLGPVPKPTWQAGTGVPPDSTRDIPDVSLFASDGAHGNFWVMCYAGYADEVPPPQQSEQACNLTGTGTGFNFTGVGGTSAAAPAFAAIMALVNQSQGAANPTGRQGNANYVLYALAQNAGASCNSSLPGTITNTSCVFYDITKGNNSVECAAGSQNCSNTGTSGNGVLVEPSTAPFSASNPGWMTTTGYDLATGLGSVNVANLASNWGSVFGAYKSDTTAITAPAAGSVSITHGANVNFTVTVTQGSGTVVPTGDVSLIAEPPGFPQFSVGGATLTNGSATIATNQLPGDTTSGAGTAYPVIAHYAGDGTFAPSNSAAFNVIVNRENSSVASSMWQYAANPPTTITSSPYGSLYLLRYDVLGSAPNDNQICANVAIPCPTGTITVTYDGGKPLNDFLSTATGSSTNVATLNVLGLVEDRILGSTGLPGGAHTIVAAYSGDNSYNASTGTALAVTITPASTLTSVTANGGSTATVNTGANVTLVATVGGCAVLSTPSLCAESSNGAGPTGSVTFSTCGTATSCTKTVVPVSFNNSGAVADAYATATLNTTFATTGTQTITASFTTGDTNYSSCATAAACEVGSAVVTVSNTVGPAAKLVFTTQLSNVVVSTSITPAVKVSIEDTNGNVVTTATNAVTIAIGTNPGGGTLGGTLTATPANGVATFSNLSINQTGIGYTLAASANPALTAATSSTFNVTAAGGGSVAVTYSPQPLILNSTTGAASTLTVTVTPSGAFTGTVAVTPTAATLPPGVTCTPSPLNISVTTAAAAAGQLMCSVTATSTAQSASILREDRMLDAKVMPPTNAVPPTTNSKAWWALSAGTGFAAMFLMFLPGGRKKYRAALGLGLICLLGITLGCNGVGGGHVTLTQTTTKMTVTAGKEISPATFSFSVSVTGGTPTGQVQLFDGATMIGTAAAVSGGTAAPTAPALSVGTHSISAHYLGDATTAASQSGTLNLTETGSTTIAITTTPAATPVAAPINVTVQ